MFDRRLQELASHPTLDDDILSLAKICSTETIVDFARKLLSYHRPATAAPSMPAKVATCESCGAEVDAKAAAYCRFHGSKFGKRIMCRPCQARLTAARRILPQPRRGAPASGRTRSRSR
jgi:hypothetical protein